MLDPKDSTERAFTELLLLFIRFLDFCLACLAQKALEPYFACCVLAHVKRIATGKLGPAAVEGLVFAEDNFVFVHRIVKALDTICSHFT